MKLVGISGSLREGSSNAALLRALQAMMPADSELALYEDLGTLPHFNPDLDAEGGRPPESVEALRRLLMAADGIIISSPEYAHGVPGSLKNALDWLVSTGELVGKPVVLVNAAPVGGEHAQASLLETLRTMNWNVLADASLMEPFVARRGRFDEPAVLENLRGILAALRAHAADGGAKQQVMDAM
jgi:chromate reductase